MSVPIDIVLDGVICSLAVLIAISIFFVRKVITSILLFMCFGLVITLCWIRLNAIVVAIAEAAVGAGLTGAMLIAAWRKLGEN